MRTLRVCLLLAAASLLYAWNAVGHRTVAFIAYQKLTPRARANVDRLLQSHPDYKQWILGIPAAQRPLVAFLRSSTWADEIKGDPNYQDEPRDAPPPQHPSYPDHFRHRNWHYIDTPLTGSFDSLHIDSSKTAWHNPPNAVTQIAVMEDILRNRRSPDAEKAWALGWLVHLVGDLHQPLHCASRSTTDAAGKEVSDAGGNRVLLTGRPHNLHAFWDDAVGVNSSTPAVRELGADLIAASSASDLRGQRDLKPDHWVTEGTRLSIDFVYAGIAGLPAKDGAIKLSPAYKRVAESAAAQRVTLGGYRLANLLNKLLSH